MDWIRIKATNREDGMSTRYVRCDHDGRLETVPMESEWMDAVVDKAGTTSHAVDLQAGYKELLVLVPTIDSATTTVHVAKEIGGTYYPVYAFDMDGTGAFAHASTKATTSIALVFKIGGARYVKVVFSDAQNTAERVIPIKGIN